MPHQINFSETFGNSAAVALSMAYYPGRAVQPYFFKAVRRSRGGVEAAVGHPDMTEFAEATKTARTFAEYGDVVQRTLGPDGLMRFTTLDPGAVLRKETGLDTPKMVRLILGNRLIMKEMAKHVPDTGSYAPVTVLLDERPDGVHLSYDRMARLRQNGEVTTEWRAFKNRARPSPGGGVSPFPAIS